MRRSLEHSADSIIFFRDFRALSADRAAQIVQAQHEYDQDFRMLIERAAEQGLLRPGVTSTFAARAVFGMANWIHYWYDPRGSISANEVVEELSAYAMASLLAPLPPEA